METETRTNVNQYAATALLAANLISLGTKPSDAWTAAAAQCIQSPSSRRKGCPKVTFLSFFLPDDEKVRSSKNARYAANALEILKSNPDQVFTPSELWKCVMEREENQAQDNGKAKKHNAQMHVVLALWENKLIE